MKETQKELQELMTGLVPGEFQSPSPCSLGKTTVKKIMTGGVFLLREVRKVSLRSKTTTEI